MNILTNQTYDNLALLTRIQLNGVFEWIANQRLPPLVQDVEIMLTCSDIRYEVSVAFQLMSSGALGILNLQDRVTNEVYGFTVGIEGDNLQILEI